MQPIEQERKKKDSQGELTVTEQRIKNGHRERQWTSQLYSNTWEKKAIINTFLKSF